jgi:hypothetical protein
MIILLVKHAIAFLYLLAGSISDFKTREVADWANYGLMAFGVSINLILRLHIKIGIILHLAFLALPHFGCLP